MQLQTSVAFWARQAPGKPAIAVGKDVLYSYGELHNSVNSVAHWLSTSEWQLVRGDRVVLLITNSPAFFECLFACWHLGLVVVPVNTRLHPRELRFIVKQSGARLCLCSRTLSSRFIEAGVPVIDVDSTAYKQAKTVVPPHPVTLKHPQEKTFNDKDLAWIFYTSGTTGQPKGAMLSFRNLTSMCQCYFRDVDNQAPWSSILHPAPLSHGSGLYSLAHLLRGSCQVLPESEGFDEDEIFQLIAQWPDTVFFAAPTMIRRLTQHNRDYNTSSLKCILFGGAPMYFEDIREYIDRFGPKLAQLYGQGESPMTITAYTQSVVADTGHPRWEHRVQSAGKPQSAVSVACVDANGFRVEPGEIGEVIVRGNSVMDGYWNNPGATAGALKDGWLYTGDLGSFDSEGFLTLKDRSKDMLISGGSNIYPREIEEVLLMHPQVQEVSVVGKPNREWGEIVVAFVVTKDATIDIETLVETDNADTSTVESETEIARLMQEMNALCLGHIARYKRPRFYRFIDTLPKNNYGKVLKTKLRSEFESSPG